MAEEETAGVRFGRTEGADVRVSWDGAKFAIGIGPHERNMVRGTRVEGGGEIVESIGVRIRKFVCGVGKVCRHNKKINVAFLVVLYGQLNASESCAAVRRVVRSDGFRPGAFPSELGGRAQKEADSAGISSLLGNFWCSVEEEQGSIWGFSGLLRNFTPSFLKDNDVYARRRHSMKKFLFRGVGQTFAIEGLYDEILKISGPRGGASLRRDCGGEGGQGSSAHGWKAARLSCSEGAGASTAHSPTLGK